MEDRKNEREHDNCNRLILKKEEQMIDFSNEERKIEDSLHSLEKELHRGFQTLNELNDESSRLSGTEISWLQRKNEEQERSFRQLLRESEEYITSAYKKETKKMDDERETLYKKRSEIPWD